MVGGQARELSMSSVIKLSMGMALAMMFALAPTPMSGGDAWAQSKPKKGCECMNFCKTGSGNKCVACRNKCS